MTWAEAFRRQAASDYQVFKQFSAAGSRVAVCHRLHFLQMATEKLAKSFLVGDSSEPPRQTHQALVTFLRVVSSRPEIRVRLKFGNDPKQFRAYINKLVPLAARIEDLAPAGGKTGRSNPEYPWLNSQQQVVCPADYRFPEFAPNEITRVAAFTESLLRIAQ